jgi:hypothetical protein
LEGASSLGDECSDHLLDVAGLEYDVSSSGSSKAQPVGLLREPLLGGDKGGGGGGGGSSVGGGNGVFNDLGRYDSPPTDGTTAPLHTGMGNAAHDSSKFVIGSNNSSNDPKSFGNIQATFGSDTISPYDILTNYTNRRNSTRRGTLTGGGGGSGVSSGSSNKRLSVSKGSSQSDLMSASAPRDLTYSHRGSGEFARPSSLTSAGGLMGRGGAGGGGGVPGSLQGEGDVILE